MTSGKSHDSARVTASATAAEAKPLREFVELNADWLWALDREGRCPDASPRVVERLGSRVDEVLGRTLGFSAYGRTVDALVASVRVEADRDARRQSQCRSRYATHESSRSTRP